MYEYAFSKRRLIIKFAQYVEVGLYTDSYI